MFELSIVNWLSQLFCLLVSCAFDVASCSSCSAWLIQVIRHTGFPAVILDILSWPGMIVRFLACIWLVLAYHCSVLVMWCLQLCHLNALEQLTILMWKTEKQFHPVKASTFAHLILASSDLFCWGWRVHGAGTEPWERLVWSSRSCRWQASRWSCTPPACRWPLRWIAAMSSPFCKGRQMCVLARISRMPHRCWVQGLNMFAFMFSKLTTCLLALPWSTFVPSEYWIASIDSIEVIFHVASAAKFVLAMAQCCSGLCEPFRKTCMMTSPGSLGPMRTSTMPWRGLETCGEKSTLIAGLAFGKSRWLQPPPGGLPDSHSVRPPDQGKTSSQANPPSPKGGINHRPKGRASLSLKCEEGAIPHSLSLKCEEGAVLHSLSLKCEEGAIPHRTWASPKGGRASPCQGGKDRYAARACGWAPNHEPSTEEGQVLLVLQLIQLIKHCHGHSKWHGCMVSVE